MLVSGATYRGPVAEGKQLAEVCVKTGLPEKQSLLPLLVGHTEQSQPLTSLPCSEHTAKEQLKMLAQRYIQRLVRSLPSLPPHTAGVEVQPKIGVCLVTAMHG